MHARNIIAYSHTATYSVWFRFLMLISAPDNKHGKLVSNSLKWYLDCVQPAPTLPKGQRIPKRNFVVQNAHALSWTVTARFSRVKRSNYLDFPCFFTACKDLINYCHVYKPYCKHEDYSDFVKVNCKKTCDLCPKGNFWSFKSFKRLASLKSTWIVCLCLSYSFPESPEIVDRAPV